MLKSHSAQIVRLLFLMFKWDAPMHYNPDGELIDQVYDLNRSFTNFFALTRAVLRDVKISDIQKWETHDFELDNKLNKAIQQVHKDFCNNINTPDVLSTLQNLVSDANIYIVKCERKNVRAPLLRKTAEFTLRILQVLGLTVYTPESLQYDIKFDDTNNEETIRPVVDHLVSFRSTVRDAARQIAQACNTHTDNAEATKAIRALSRQLLQNSDALRDSELPSIGIQLEDHADGTVWKAMPKEELARQMAQKKEAEEQAAAEKAKKKQVAQEAADKKAAEARIPPTEYFLKVFPDKYTQVDEEGIPTVNTDGSQVSKSLRDKCKKLLEKHKKVYEKAMEGSN